MSAERLTKQSGLCDDDSAWKSVKIREGNMEDIDYNTLFGLEEEEQAEDQPETEEPQESGEEDDAAEDAGTAEKSTEEDTGTETDAGNAEKSTAQGRDEHAKYAAARRKAEAERDAAVAQAKKAAQDEMDKTLREVLDASGLKDPFTGAPIRTKEEFDRYRQGKSDETRRNLQRKSGMTPEEFDSFVAELPEVKAAKEAKEKADAEARKAAETQAKARVDAELQEIRKLNPKIRTLADLTGLENYDALYEKVLRGYSLSDAYRLVNLDALTRQAAEAGKQEAMNAAQSKQHMARTKTKGAGDVEISKEETEAFRLFNPDLSAAEIRDWCRKHRK